MTLYAGKNLRSVLEADGNTEALRLMEEKLDAVRWAVYRVRRIVWAKGRADRKTEKLAEGSRTEMANQVVKQGGVPDGGTTRLYLLRRGDQYPTREEMLVAAPGSVAEKSRPGFEENWTRLSGPTLWSE